VVLLLVMLRAATLFNLINLNDLNILWALVVLLLVVLSAAAVLFNFNNLNLFFAWAAIFNFTLNDPDLRPDLRARLDGGGWWCCALNDSLNHLLDNFTAGLTTLLNDNLVLNNLKWCDLFSALENPAHLLFNAVWLWLAEVLHADIFTDVNNTETVLVMLFMLLVVSVMLLVMTGLATKTNATVVVSTIAAAAAVVATAVNADDAESNCKAKESKTHGNN